ncbi:GNAT family N-acetyltransferase [Paenisporosarcina indica]|uniref:GNAT family N-acetyltransferase n=1 Tax=Paenisporosarcina indica TaxID=650093 RepID=UPI0009502A90|nr:GNAT family N-acetyltransferase [Paenisporosarcina indica]
MLQIREALSNEIDSVREQRVRAYEEHAQKVPAEHWNALKKGILSDTDEQSGVELIVAEWDGEVVGSIVLYPAKSDAYSGLVDELDYPEIRMLAVTPQARSKGIAEALVNECIHRAKQKEYKYIGLHTADFMNSAMRLYERIGFERLPQYDFEPANDGIIVKAYRLSIE